MTCKPFFFLSLLLISSFSGVLRETAKILAPQCNITFLPSDEGSAKGAALITAVERQKHEHKKWFLIFSHNLESPAPSALLYTSLQVSSVGLGELQMAMCRLKYKWSHQQREVTHAEDFTAWASHTWTQPFVWQLRVINPVQLMDFYKMTTVLVKPLIYLKPFLSPLKSSFFVIGSILEMAF